jgi:hypothetical protein
MTTTTGVRRRYAPAEETVVIGKTAFEFSYTRLEGGETLY